jgi:DNA adenine methylase
MANSKKRVQATSTRLTLPLKWHGGKYYIAPEINDLMPPHLHYVEAYFGGGSVLLAHPAAGEGRSELLNDMNKALINFWRVLKSEASFSRFQRIVQAIPLSRDDWESSSEWMADADPVVAAVGFFVRCRQSLAGRMKSFTSPTRTRLRRGMNGNVSEWLGAIEGLQAVHERLRRVFIENMDAMDLIRREDTAETLFYLDPPYPHETRTSTDVYHHEMALEQHKALLDLIRACKGKVMISGYRNNLYDQALADWWRHTFDLPNNAAGGGTKRRMTEVLWCSFDPEASGRSNGSQEKFQLSDDKGAVPEEEVQR